jgi:hypothetical protein
LLLPVVGGLSLLWYLLRVVPKPSRAAYPCQRAAVPMAASFLAWIAALVTWRTAAGWWKRCRSQGRLARAFAALALTLAALAATLRPWITAPVRAQAPAYHPALGEAGGIHPGRVVWVHAPEATDWEGPDSAERWYASECTDPAVVERMVSTAVQNLAGESSDAAAWNAIMTHFNARRGRGEHGYRAGEKVAVKLNLVTCYAAQKGSTPWVDPVTHEKTRYPNNVDVAPQMAGALLRQLVSVVGVAQADIAIGGSVLPARECEKSSVQCFRRA